MDNEVLELRLREQTRFAHLIAVQSCPSTQELAASAQPEGDLIAWSEEQTAGRGRLGRSWDSSPGLDLALTLRTEHLHLEDPQRLAAAIPTAILTALESASGLRLGLKWPNDLQWQGRKLCGVLIDLKGKPLDRFLIGVGVNVNRCTFPLDLQDLATSLALATGEEFDRRELVLAIARSIDAALSALSGGGGGDLEAVFCDRLGCLGKPVQLSGEGIDASGRLTAVDFDTATLDDGRSFSLAHIVRLARG